MRKHNERYSSPQLENFLCFSTRFQEDERLTVEQALNHMYFANFDPDTYASANKSIILNQFKLFIRSEQTNVPKFYAANILKILSTYYLKGDRWYMLGDAFVDAEEDNGTTVLHKESVELEYLQYELGIDMDLLWDKLSQAIDSNYQVFDI